MSSKILRVVRWFEKSPGEACLGDAELKGITLEQLQKIFNVDPNNPMYESWPIKAEHVPALQPYLEISIELNLFDYFVEVDAIDINIC